MTCIRENKLPTMMVVNDTSESGRGRRRGMMRLKNVNKMVCGVSSLVYCLGSVPVLCEGFVGTSSLSSTAFVSSSSSSSSLHRRRSKVCVGIYAPPHSGYTEPDEEEVSHYPDTYEPMMAYPGTMRPGTMPENQPFSSLPIQDTDPDPVPWPHFQEIEWHHQWGSPHEHAIPMEEFIELEGRWATAEEEAAMRAGVRRNVRERRELEEAEKGSSSVILDDDDDDDDDIEDQQEEVKLDLGEGVRSVLQATATTLPEQKQPTAQDDDDDDDDDEDDDFLLDLGLDSDDLDEDDDDDDQDDKDNGDEPAFPTGGDSPEELLNAMQSMIDAAGTQEDDDVDDDDDDLNIDLGLLDLNNDDDDDDDDTQVEDDDDDLAMFDEDDDDDDQMVPLDDMIGNEDSDENGDSFDDGGFDYDDFDNDNDGGDMY